MAFMILVTRSAAAWLKPPSLWPLEGSEGGWLARRIIAHQFGPLEPQRRPSTDECCRQRRAWL